MVYYISARRQLFQIFTQSLDAIDVTSVTLKRLNSINADDVTRYLGDILGIFWEYLGDILGISLRYLWDILGTIGPFLHWSIGRLVECQMLSSQ